MGYREKSFVNLLSAQQVAFLVDCSIYTLNNWYRWKELHPKHKLAKLLPKYQQHGERQTRYWKQEDVWKLIEFKTSIPRGNKGIMADVTQRYVKKEKRNGKK